MRNTNGHTDSEHAAGMGAGDRGNAVADAEWARRQSQRDFAEATQALRRAEREAQAACITLVVFALFLAWAA